MGRYHYVFPKWTNLILPGGLAVGALAPIYVIYVVAYGFSPKTTDVGYQPIQPVPFSHELHAGQLGLDCRYCHSTVEHAAKAAIPATETCMTCHRQVQKDSKAIALDDTGSVKDFTMNDKCAAGTGRFLEVMAKALEVDLDRFGQFSLKADQPAKISSLCTVFAESEVISLISNGEKRENIIAGIHESIAARVVAMANRTGLKRPIMMTGGVAKNIGVVKALERKIGQKIEVSPQSQMTGAIGAALLAQKA